jgi:hypothetical protein
LHTTQRRPYAHIVAFSMQTAHAHASRGCSQCAPESCKRTQVHTPHMGLAHTAPRLSKHIQAPAAGDQRCAAPVQAIVQSTAAHPVVRQAGSSDRHQWEVDERCPLAFDLGVRQCTCSAKDVDLCGRSPGAAAASLGQARQAYRLAGLGRPSRSLLGLHSTLMAWDVKMRVKYRLKNQRTRRGINSVCARVDTGEPTPPF